MPLFRFHFFLSISEGIGKNRDVHSNNGSGVIKREPMTHSPSVLESNSRISFGVTHNNSQHSVPPCNPWLYHQQHQEPMVVNSLEQMTAAILPTSVSSSFLDQLPNHSHGYSNSSSSQLIVQSSPSPDSLGDSVSIVSNMARRASATYIQSTSNIIPLPTSSSVTSSSSSLVNSPVSHSNESRTGQHHHLSLRSTANLHHQQQSQPHQLSEPECEELDSRISSNPHHSHFIYAFQCSLCDTKDDIRN